MHEVHTCTRFGEPLTMVRMRWMLGFQRRFERTCEWLMLTPNDGFLPQTSHTAAMTRFSNSGEWASGKATGEAEIAATGHLRSENHGCARAPRRCRIALGPAGLPGR